MYLCREGATWTNMPSTNDTPVRMWYGHTLSQISLLSHRKEIWLDSPFHPPCAYQFSASRNFPLKIICNKANRKWPSKILQDQFKILFNIKCCIIVIYISANENARFNRFSAQLAETAGCTQNAISYDKTAFSGLGFGLNFNF